MSTTTNLLNTRPSAQLYVHRICGSLPKVGGEVALATKPCKLTKDQAKRAYAGVAELALAAQRYQLQNAEITLENEEGEIVARGRLVDHPDGESYIVQDVVRGTNFHFQEWFVKNTLDWGKKRARI